jgi:hypothetical protein
MTGREASIPDTSDLVVVGPVRSSSIVGAHAATAAIPWFLWCAALAVTSAYVGGYWDISWHRSIGRDSFWTPAHMAIYGCGVLAGLSSAYLIFGTTFGKLTELRASSVRIWGLYGPIGAFIGAWGGLAMLVSAPFDNWWHNAYGLDVRIISPPHMVLAAGFFGIEFGTVLLVLAFMNRASSAARPALERLFLYVGGTVVCESLLLKMEYISRSDMHSAQFYAIVMFGTPATLIAIAVATGRRWGATIQAAVYTAYGLAFLWILPLFPAHPALGPVYRMVTHFIPWEFPLLLVVPALLIDLLVPRTEALRTVPRAILIGVCFLGSFIAVQWPAATLLMRPSARNWFFGAGYMDFSTPPTSIYARFLFGHREATSAAFVVVMGVALLIACAMAWIGLVVGRAMTRVRR